MLSDADKAKLFRERFYGRQDVFGLKNYYQRDDGTQAYRYSPQCANLWTENCGLRTKSNGCSTCEIKRHVPVTDDAVLKHIRGEHEALFYVVLTDGTVRFAAIDFDRKPGKEADGYTWHEVRSCRAVLAEWGLPSYAARSTTAGWHLYLFFSEFYSAHKIQHVLYELFERTGIMEMNRLNIKALAEIFPKQAYVGRDGIGNGIKPPMIEPALPKGKNCFVIDKDGEDHVIGEGLPFQEMLKAQWEYLAATSLISSAQLDGVIEKEQIEIPEERAPSANGRSYSSGLGRVGKNSVWQPAVGGSIEKVLEGCAAFRKVRDKALGGQVLGHSEGFALYHMCKSTNDGLDWFAKSVPGWGENDQQKAQLEHSLEKNYSPWTCAKMQEAGLCAPRTQCFKPKPPVEVIDGQNVVRNDVPQSDWRPPSPIRYAFGRGEDFLLKLMAEALALKGVADGEEKVKALKALAYRAQVFDVDQQKEFKAYIKKEKIARAGDISKIFHEAGAEARADDQKNLEESDSVFYIHGNQYQKLTPYGYALLKGPRGRKTSTVLSDIDINIEEIRSYISDGKVTRLVYHGVVRGPYKERHFELPSDFWEDNTEFKKYFGGLLGPNFNVLRQNIDGLRQAASGFSRKLGITETEFMTTQGWVKDTYVMPSVIVDKEGVKPNTEKKVDLTGKAFASSYDFKILSDEEFKSTMLHIKADLLNTWPRLWTTVGLAHTMLPAVKHVLGMERRASLFYEGLTGAGKTELMCALQWFWGNFRKVLNLKSSGNGALYEAFECKDALMAIDDYKGLDKYQRSALHDLLHYGYDGHVSTKLQRDGTPRELKMVRAVVIATGEQFLDDSSSVIARTILIEVKKHNTAATVESYTRCQEKYPLYQGITPRFIHWLLNQDVAALKADLATIQADLLSELEEKVNSARIATNLGVNHLTWRLWTGFMLEAGVIGPKAQEELIQEHRLYVSKLAWDTALRCESEQNSHLFVNDLRYLILSKEVRIENLEGFRTESHKRQIGHMADEHWGKNCAFIHPETAWSVVQSYRPKDHCLSGTPRSVGRQLVEAGYAREGKDGAPTMSIKVGGAQVRYWLIDLERMGVTAKLRIVNPDEDDDSSRAAANIF